MLHASVGRGDLYLCLDCCEQRCGECWGASVEFKLDGFLGIQAQVWACWIPGIARLNRLVFFPFLPCRGLGSPSLGLAVASLHSRRRPWGWAAEPLVLSHVYCSCRLVRLGRGDCWGLTSCCFDWHPCRREGCRAAFPALEVRAFFFFSRFPSLQEWCEGKGPVARGFLKSGCLDGRQAHPLRRPCLTNAGCQEAPVAQLQLPEVSAGWQHLPLPASGDPGKAVPQGRQASGAVPSRGVPEPTPWARLPASSPPSPALQTHPRRGHSS